MHRCIQCGCKTDFKKLNSGVWACENCLNEVGREQKIIKEEIERVLSNSGCKNCQEMCDKIESISYIIRFIISNSSVSKISHLLNSLDAISKVIRYENNLLNKKETEKLKKEIEKY